MNEKKQKQAAAVILLVVESVIALLIAWRQGMAVSNPFSLNARYLSDGCFVIGLTVSGIGALTWIASTGFFDMMSYGIGYGVRVLLGVFSINRKPKNRNFYEYKMAKAEKRSEPIYFILVCGMIFVLLSLVFLKCYYMN